MTQKVTNLVAIYSSFCIDDDIVPTPTLHSLECHQVKKASVSKVMLKRSEVPAGLCCRHDKDMRLRVANQRIVVRGIGQ